MGVAVPFQPLNEMPRRVRGRGRGPACVKLWPHNGPFFRGVQFFTIRPHYNNGSEGAFSGAKKTAGRLKIFPVFRFSFLTHFSNPPSLLHVGGKAEEWFDMQGGKKATIQTRLGACTRISGEVTPNIRPNQFPG